MAAQSSWCQSGMVAEVVPLLKVRSLGDRSFDYVVPEALSGRVRVGSIAEIEFGKRQTRGVVVGCHGKPDGALTKLKSLDSVEDQYVPAELMDLAYQMAERYVAPLEVCLRLVVPPVPRQGGSRESRSTETLVFCADVSHQSAPESASVRLTDKQRALLARIPPSGIRPGEACRSAGVSRSVLEALLAKGIVQAREPLSPDTFVDRVEIGANERAWPQLSSEQETARDVLVDDLHSAGLAHRQLWGVTGSGKTEVYLRLIAECLGEEHGVILLVPEIALTPMMVQRVQERFKDQVGVLHSRLSAGQRRRQYQSLAAGQAKVVVGARSAVFAPVQDLRLIIIDESHDSSYKQEEAPGYHVRTVGLMRLERAGGLLLEGSASPAVEVMADQSELVRMRDRVRGRLPTVETVDMRHASGGALLAGVTREALRQVVVNGEQAIVLLNRRGYAGHVHCDTCGHVMMCGDCELSLTYHDRTKSLVCHHCGRSYSQPNICPNCEQAPMARGVPGTERLAEQLSKLFPLRSVFRLDSDVLTSGSRAQRILETFSTTRPALLVGTQMVAKGHDFEDVTLAVVADADTGLYVPDFRAAERTFQLITQVSGRAGRADRPGRVIVQTWNPEVPCIRMALDRKEEAFYRREVAIRERLGYPPFTELIRLLMTGERPQHVRAAAEHLADSLGRHLGPAEVRGPARLVGLRGRSRWHVVLTSQRGEAARAMASRAVNQLSGPYKNRGVTLTVDVDPYSFV